MTVDGVKMGVTDGFKAVLEKNGLGREEGESMSDWSARCKAWVRETSFGNMIRGIT